METEIKSRLYDVLNAINEIDSFFDDLPKNFEAYQNDIRTKRAVERNISIIGEAVNRIIQQDDSILLSNSRQIIATRNRIIHGYDQVSDEILWGIINVYLPALRENVCELLGES